MRTTATPSMPSPIATSRRRVRRTKDRTGLLADRRPRKSSALDALTTNIVDHEKCTIEKLTWFLFGFQFKKQFLPHRRTLPALCGRQGGSARKIKAQEGSSSLVMAVMLDRSVASSKQIHRALFLPSKPLTEICGWRFPSLSFTAMPLARK